MSRTSRVEKLEQAKGAGTGIITVIRALFVRSDETGQPVYTGRAYVSDLTTGEGRFEERPDLEGQPAGRVASPALSNATAQG